MTPTPVPNGNPLPPPQTAPLRPPLARGTLYLVATPIGNLEDMTLRAVRTLKECDVIAAEDTRHTARLLNHLGIRKPLVSCHQFNEARRGEDLIKRLRNGEIVALVSDAGSPGVSDPGERLVRKAIEAGLRVEAVPGACALIAALTTSGLPTREFHFAGFLPNKSAARKRLLGLLGAQRGTLVIYESPHRILKVVEEIAQLWPTRQIVLARELTKKFEEIIRGRSSEVLTKFRTRSQRGEYVVLLEPFEPGMPESAESDSADEMISQETSPDSEDSTDPGPA